MKCLIDKKEIEVFLTSLIDPKEELKKEGFDNFPMPYTTEFLNKMPTKMLESRSKNKLKDKILRNVKDDLSLFKLNAERIIADTNHKKELKIKKNLDFLIEKLGPELVLENYKKSKTNNFVKSTGLSINKNAEFMYRNDYTNFKQDCIFRNMAGLEKCLLDKMNNNWPFWFIDTGYTNFLHGKNKVWHRLVRNSLHHSGMFNAPTDRLENFKCFPKPWRPDGDKILLIEPGPFCAKTFNIDIGKWKSKITSEIRKYTDKEVVVREKVRKKGRSNLYKELLDEDYYCVISLNSNASTESIWAGIPAITLKRHITNPVTKNKISDINNLYRGQIADWLCCLSYSQFTKEELLDGTAVRLFNEFHT